MRITNIQKKQLIDAIWQETIEAFQSWMHEVNGAVYAAAVQAENESID
jgi:hypothetical protein